MDIDAERVVLVVVVVVISSSNSSSSSSSSNGSNISSGNKLLIFFVKGRAGSPCEKRITAHTPERQKSRTQAAREAISGTGGQGRGVRAYWAQIRSARPGWQPPGPGREAPRSGNGGTGPQQEQDTSRDEGFEFIIGVEI